ncbi:MAG: hypothetical protein QXJ86_05610 [Nitrososphaerales archaeon]
MLRFELHYTLCLATAVILGLVYAFQNFYPDFMYIFSNASPLFVAGAAAATAYMALNKYAHNLRLRFSIIWLCFAIGITLWFLGELSWSIYTLILGVEIPYPSLADAFWLSGYAPLFAALLLYVKNFRLVLTKLVVSVNLTIIVMLCILLSVYVIPQIATEQTNLTVLILGLAYPILDLILLSLAIFGSMVFFKGGLGRSWLLISLALIFICVADILFTYTTLQETYFNGHPLELFFHWGYILYALAFYVHIKEL